MDTSDSSARDAHEPHGEEAHEASEELRRSCFYCLEGWVFLGSIGPDGEEVYEAVRCRRCGSTGNLELTRSNRSGRGPAGFRPFFRYHVLHGVSRNAWGFRCSRLFTRVPSRRR